jgi:Membrane-bound metallopeptidase
MDKAETALSGSFAKNKGRLPYPVTGSFSVVGHFGTQQHAQLKYVVTNNSGIDIMARPGAEARAVFDGVVSRVFIVPGYNSSVIIRHGNYLTVYSNLSHVYVKSGDAVNTRQSIGKIFTDTENDNQTRMQFQLWKETSKQNPEAWLRR